jgi:hypothetical protein
MVATFRRKIRCSREVVPNGVGAREKRREGVGKEPIDGSRGGRYFLQGRMIEGRRDDAESEEREEIGKLSGGILFSVSLRGEDRY